MEQGAVAMIAPQEPEFRQKLKALRHHPRHQIPSAAGAVGRTGLRACTHIDARRASSEHRE